MGMIEPFIRTAVLAGRSATIMLWIS